MLEKLKGIIDKVLRSFKIYELIIGNSQINPINQILIISY